MKRSILCIALALIMLIGAVPFAASAAEADVAETGSTMLTEAKLAGGRAPVVGEVPNRSFGVHTFDEKYYSAVFLWYDMTEERVMLSSTEKIADTKTYALFVSFTPKSGYFFPRDVRQIDIGFYNDIHPTAISASLKQDTGALNVYFIFRMSGCNSRVVTFDANDASGYMRPLLVNYGGQYTLPECDFNRSDGFFSCWSAGCVGDSICVTKDIKIKAIWTYSNIPRDNIGDLIFTGGKQPEAGAKPDYSFSVHKKHADRYYLGRVEWWNLSDDRKMATYDTFEASKVYALRLAVTAKDGYYFISNTPFLPNSDSSVNRIEFAEDISYAKHVVYDISETQDRVVYFIFKMESSDCVLSYKTDGGTGEMRPRAYTYGAYVNLAECGFDPPESYQEFYSWNYKNYVPGDRVRLLSDLSLTAVWANANQTIVDTLNIRITEPRVGEAPDYDVTVAMDDIEKYTANFYGKWYDASLTRDMASGETFQKNHAYSFEISFVPKQKHRFARPEEMTVNLLDTSSQTLSTYITTSGDDLQSTRFVTFYYGVPSTYLNRLDATITAPRAGSAPSSAARTSTAGVTVDEVKWYSGGTISDPGSLMSGSSAFAAGGIYIAELTFHADIHYAIDTYAQAKINSGSYMPIPSTVNKNDPLIRVFRFSFSLPAAGNEIKTLSATFTVPEDGDELPITAAAGNTSYRITDIGWYTEGSVTSPKAQLMPGNRAVAGKTYYAMFRFTPSSDAAIADNAAATINGLTATKNGDIRSDGSACFVIPVTISENGGAILVGDVNGDGSVNNRDAMILDRYVAGWTGYEEKIKSMDAADLNRDGSVNNRDAMTLDRYIAGWTGYAKYIITV